MALLWKMWIFDAGDRIAGEYFPCGKHVIEIPSERLRMCSGERNHAASQMMNACIDRWRSSRIRL